MRQLLLIFACGCVFMVPERSLAAQTVADTTTASFRQGEWGVGFIVRSGVTDGGVLRFSTPTRAWVLDGSASFDHQSLSGSTVFGEQTQSTSNVSAQFGPRWYHPMSGHVARYLGFGVSGDYGRSELSGASSHATFWSVGAYGEAGMQYMLTRYLGLGWRGTFSASRGDASNSELTPQGSNSTTQATMYHVGLDAVQLTGTIYF